MRRKDQCSVVSDTIHWFRVCGWVTWGLLGGYFQSDVSLANRSSNCTVMVLSGASRAIWPENLERHSVTMLESAYPDTAPTCAFVI